MTIAEKIIDHHKSKYQNSPVKVSKKEIAIFRKNHCQCWNCGKSIFELENYPSIRNGEVYCHECEYEKFYSTCPICEEYFEHATKAEDEILIISKEAIKEYDFKIKPGFYRVKKWPFYYGNVVSGFEGLYDDTIELIREVDINSMLYRLYPHNGDEKISAGECCVDCMKKYTGQTEIVNNYCNKRYGKKIVKLTKQVILEGK